MQKRVTNEDLFKLTTDIRDRFDKFEDKFDTKLADIEREKHADHKEIWVAINDNGKQISNMKGFNSALSVGISFVTSLFFNFIKRT